jgi:hypothetical protein
MKRSGNLITATFTGESPGCSVADVALIPRKAHPTAQRPENITGAHREKAEAAPAGFVFVRPFKTRALCVSRMPASIISDIGNYTTAGFTTVGVRGH